MDDWGDVGSGGGGVVDDDWMLTWEMIEKRMKE